MLIGEAGAGVDTGDDLTVALNLSHVQHDLPPGLGTGQRVLLSTYLDDSADPGRLRPDEGLVLGAQ